MSHYGRTKIIKTPYSFNRLRQPKNESAEDGRHPYFDDNFLNEVDQPRFKDQRHTIYEDGTTRRFGKTQKPDYQEEKSVKTQKGKEFIYESGDRRYQTHRRFKPNDQTGRKPEDTRSLYDDPKIQKMRRLQTRKLIEKNSKNPSQITIDEPQWIPLEQTAQVPKSFYMKIDFTSYYGPTNVEPQNVRNEYEAFKLFFDNEIYAMILEHTQEKFKTSQIKLIYKYCNGLIKKRPLISKWDICERELDGYFAVQLFFGIVRMTYQRDYWQSRKKPFNRQYFTRDKAFEVNLESKKKIKMLHREDVYAHWIKQKMNNILSYEKFRLFKDFLCFYSSEIKQANDPIWKVRDLLNKLNERYQKFYLPDEYVAIDEGMIPFNGSIPFKVFNPDKPTKWGLKEYIICDAQTAYTLQIILYYGASMWNQEFSTEHGLTNDENTASRTMELVIQLLKNYEGKGHKVVMDNYYTSQKLFRELKNRGIGSLGTIRHNRTGLTKQDLVSKHFQQIYHKQNYAYYLNKPSDCILLYFQGTADKEVALLSTYVDNTINAHHQWDISKNVKHTTNPNQPYMVHLYNKYSGGVDRRNALVSNHRSKFIREKWWQSVFDRLFETSIVNGYLIYKAIHPNNVYLQRGVYKHFRVNLMSILAERHKDYVQGVHDGKYKPSLTRDPIDNHDFIEGEEPLLCVECGNKTKNFCQQCSVWKRKLIGVCCENVDVRCERFHAFQEFNLDRNKIVYKKNKKGGISVVMDTLHRKQEELEKQQVQLLANKCEKFQTIKNMNEIIDILKQIQSSSTNVFGKEAWRDEILNHRIKESIALIKKDNDHDEENFKNDVSDDAMWGDDISYYNQLMEGILQFNQIDTECSCINEIQQHELQEQADNNLNIKQEKQFRDASINSPRERLKILKKQLHDEEIKQQIQEPYIQFDSEIKQQEPNETPQLNNEINQIVKKSEERDSSQQYIGPKLFTNFSKEQQNSQSRQSSSDEEKKKKTKSSSEQIQKFFELIFRKPHLEKDIKSFEPKMMTPEEQFNRYRFYNQMVADRLEAEEKSRLNKVKRNFEQIQEETIENMECILNQIRMRANPDKIENIELVLQEIKEKTLSNLEIMRQQLEKQEQLEPIKNDIKIQLNEQSIKCDDNLRDLIGDLNSEDEEQNSDEDDDIQMFLKRQERREIRMMNEMKEEQQLAKKIKKKLKYNRKMKPHQNVNRKEEYSDEEILGDIDEEGMNFDEVEYEYGD